MQKTQLNVLASLVLGKRQRYVLMLLKEKYHRSRGTSLAHCDT